MRPAFSNALYYPTIEIRNRTWLKTAMFFWDSISTIVPESIVQPYRQRSTQYLADIGFLRPIFVNSDDKSVVGIEEDILELMSSSEFSQAFSASPKNKYSRVYEEKMSYRIKEQMRDFNLHPNENGHYFFDGKFAYAYMIALANKLCENHSLGMITDDTPCFEVSNAVRFGNQAVSPEDYFRNSRPKEHQFEQGMLLDFIINGLSISPETTFEKIVSFKEHHRDELGRFRTQLAKLTQDFVVDRPIDIIQQEIRDLYKNDFVPAFDDLKASLRGMGIKWATETLLKVSLLSTSATGIPMLLLGMAAPQALFIGMGVSAVAATVSYNVEKKKILRENPYSYLLSL